MKRPGTITVARISGIDLKIHFSLIFLLFYVVFVATVQFPLTVYQSGINITDLHWSPVTWGIFFAIALFLSVAIHEFGHAFVAQAQGISVRGITLMMLGGISEIERIPEKPYAEFKLAIVGPLVSLALAGILALIGSRSHSPDVIFFCYWLGSANLVLAIFNLLPAFPLDGGRALRAFLAARKGTIKATQISVKVSKLFAWAFGIWGLLSFNFFLILIAFFVYGAAQTEMFFLLSRGILRGLRVEEITSYAEPVEETISLKDAVAHMLKIRARIIPIETTDGTPALLSVESLSRVERDLWANTPVSQIMEKAPRTVDIHQSISDILPQLVSAPYQALPVQENGRLVGIIKYSDLAEILQLRSLEHPPLDQERKAA